jgi:hypothetical protein
MIAAVDVATRLQGFLSENILRAAKPHQIKIRMPGIVSRCQIARNAGTKKKPGVAGLF